MGATVGAIVALLVCSGDQKVSTKIAFTSFENNTGWNNSTLFHAHSHLDTFLTLFRRLGVPAIIRSADVVAHWL